MKRIPPAVSFAFVFLTAACVAPAQVTIGTVVNAASRIQSTSPFYGIAQGSLFAITGTGLGPDQLQQASFPLPTTDGLAGVTVQASVAGTLVDCIMVYVSTTEVGAILPSSTPLGSGTLTLNNNGATASEPIKVVATAFGVFRHNSADRAGQALAFNVSPDDGSTSPNSTVESVMPGQDVLINGTGLGAISSDETQSGVTDVPSPTIQVYVGIRPATVVSVGRGLCCDGLDADFPVPEGIAAWDVIRFTIPDGVAGCFIPVAVQIGAYVSNLATISIDPSGTSCTLQLSTLPSVHATDAKGLPSVGTITLSRSIGTALRANGTPTTTRTDSGLAGFLKFTSLPPGDVIVAETIYPANVCSINGFPGPDGTIIMNGNLVTPIPVTSVNLDAGPTITVRGPAGNRTLTRQMVAGRAIYSPTQFGNGTVGNYYDAGHYTVTGTGGPDVGPFTTAVDVPTVQFEWTNMPDVTKPLDRSKDLTIKWTGGVPNTQVTIAGGSSANGVGVAFLCAAPISAGQITVPAYVLEMLPVPTTAPLDAQFTLGNRSTTIFTATGLDLAAIHYSVAYTLDLRLQ